MVNTPHYLGFRSLEQATGRLLATHLWVGGLQPPHGARVYDPVTGTLAQSSVLVKYLVSSPYRVTAPCLNAVALHGVIITRPLPSSSE